MKLSIITINLNNIEGLRRTLSPLVYIHEQNLPVEWIVIDGGSTDGSAEEINIQKNYLAYFESTPDKGIYDAMNKGLSYAKGEYVIFMNSGDSFCKHVLTHDWLAKLTGDVIYGNYIAESKSGNQTLYVQSEKLDFLYLMRKTINHQSLFIKRNYYKCKGFDLNYKIVADWIFLFELLKNHNPTITYVNEPICIFNMDGFGTLNNTARLEERSHYLNSQYSIWEMQSLSLAGRMRSKRWFTPLVETLDSRRKESLINLLLRIIG